MSVAQPKRSGGRPLGMTNLPEQTKVSIVANKNLQIFSQSKIAQDHGVCRQTVVNLTEDKLSPEGRKELRSFVDKLAEAREKTINRINEKLDNNDFKDGVYPNLLNAVNQNYRLETNQPTQNVMVKSIAVEIVARLIEKGWQSEEAEGFVREAYPDEAE